MVKGYRIREKGTKTAVCKDCSEAISLNTESLEDLDTRQYASELCVVCEEDITNGNGGKISYPEEIAVLIGHHFKDSGGRFGGVYPVIDSGKNVDKIKKGVKKVEPVRTNYDPVVIQLQSEEAQIAEELERFSTIVSKRGRIRGKRENITDDEGNIVGYEFTFFAVQ